MQNYERKTHALIFWRFSFTGLDPSDHDRKFWFELEAADHGMSISDCEPALDFDFLKSLTNDLNNTDDMLGLVQAMRRAFLQTLEDNWKWSIHGIIMAGERLGNDYDILAFLLVTKIRIVFLEQLSVACDV